MPSSASHTQSAAIYARISSDRAGEGLGVQRQETLCRELADRKGWPVAEVYVDNDISAYSGKPRPAYERLLADLAAGQRDAVLVVDTDRLTRTPSELESFIDVCDRHSVALANVAGDVDLATSDGRFKARIMGAVAGQESEKKSERLKREREQTARAGKPHGGPRPFGWQDDRATHRPEEAALVREAATRVLAGESLRAVALDWADRGVVAPQSGKAFTTASLKAVLTNPRIAGLRRHRPRDRAGKVTSDTIYPAEWEPLVERDVYERLAAKLGKAGPSKRGRPGAHLLTGVVRCGVCKHKMYANYRQVAGKPARRYACSAGPGKDGCGRLTVTADPLDAEITRQVLAVLSGPGLAAAVADHSQDDGGGLGDELAGCEDRLEQLAGDYAEGTINRREWLAARERLNDRISELKRDLATAAGKSVLSTLPTSGDALREAWEARDVEWRRAVVSAAIEGAYIAPAGVRGGPRFNPDRIDVTWRV